MRSNLKQEFYKFGHQRVPAYGVIALFILMLYTAISQPHVNQTMVGQGFGAGQWITIIMITIASTFVAMEYENRTIVMLFYKTSHKAEIYGAKLIVIILYGLGLLLLSGLLTLALKGLLIGNRYQWLASYQQSTLAETLLLNLLGAFIYSLFIVTLAFCLIALIQNNSAVVGIGLVIAFLGAPFSDVIMDNFRSFIPVLKWNPFNMIYVMNQLAAPHVFMKASYLTNSQIIGANMIYALIFALIGYLLFKRHRV